MFSFFSLSLELDCGILCWPTRRFHWADAKSGPLNPQVNRILNCSRCLVGIKTADTCWFNLTFLTPSPDVGCFVFSNQMPTIWCYIYVLAFCCLWSSCHGQFSQFMPDMNNALLRNHDQSAMLIQTGSDLFKKKKKILPLVGMSILRCGMLIVYKCSHFLVWWPVSWSAQKCVDHML